MGTELTSASLGALLTTTTPLYVAIFAKILLKERFLPSTIAGIVLATIGSILVLTNNLTLGTGSSTLVGSLLLLGSACVWALYTVVGKPLVEKVSALTATAYSSLLSIPFVLPLLPIELSFWRPGLISLDILASIVYLGVGATAIAWWLWYKALETSKASVVGVTFFAQPVAGGLLAWILLNESPSLEFLIGAAFIILGVFLSSKNL